MKPPAFRYLRPGSLEEVVAALAEHGDEAKPLAGGQSLIPAMNFRLAQPSVLVDLELVEALRTMRRADGALHVGAMVRQRDAERSPEVRAACPLLSEALPWIGHPQNRNRGTIGGSIVHADPAAELPAVAMALDATIDLAGPARGEDGSGDDVLRRAVHHRGRAGRGRDRRAVPRGRGRRVPPAWSWRPGEATSRWSASPRSCASPPLARWSTTSAWPRSAWPPTPVRLTEAEAQVRGAELTAQAAEQAGAASAADVEAPTTDIHATGEYRRRALTELVRRALHGIGQSARG